MQKEIYETESKEIDRLQKEIIALSQKEEPYDVFICYKETDETGRRTQDSVIANDIYYQLTQEGFKVFYAAITLEDKLGSAYEPYIFAALNSAKVMLTIGTKPEYFNAVWVKNEWSRFLKIMKKDRSKVLIPCYKDMDAYELPEEFAHLQAQDMSKIGFINDIVRGIEKVLSGGASKEDKKETAIVNSNNVALDSLLERVFMFLEDGEWDNANGYCEKVLDIDPKNAYAYIGKLMAELGVQKQADLANLDRLFVENKYYKKALQFADDEFRIVLEEIGKSNKYNYAMVLQDSAYKYLKKGHCGDSIDSMRTAIDILTPLIDWKDAKEQIDNCIECIYDNGIYIKEYADELTNNHKTDEAVDIYEAAVDTFNSILDWNDSSEQIKICQDGIYNNGVIAEQTAEALMEKNEYAQAKIECKRATGIFKKIPDCKDSRKRYDNCMESLYNYAVTTKKSADEYMEKGCYSISTIKRYEEAVDTFKLILDWSDSKERLEECSRKIKEAHKNESEQKRNELDQRESERKNKMYIKLRNDYERLFNNKVSKGTREDWIAVQEGFKSLKGWDDSVEYARKCADIITQNDAKYHEAIGEANEQTISSLKKAYKLFRSISGWYDANERMNTCAEILKKKRIALIICIVIALSVLSSLIR